MVANQEHSRTAIHAILRELDQTLSRVYLLGSTQDQEFLSLADSLNPVRCVPVTLTQTMTGQTIREEIEHLVKLTAQPAAQSAVIVTGRHLGAYWVPLLTRLRTLGGAGVLISDVSEHLRLPLADLFHDYLVWPESQQRFSRALERWHRHDQFAPAYKTIMLDQNVVLYRRG